MLPVTPARVIFGLLPPPICAPCRPAVLLAVLLLQAVTKAAAGRHATASAGRIELRLRVDMRTPPDGWGRSLDEWDEKTESTFGFNAALGGISAGRGRRRR